MDKWQDRISSGFDRLVAFASTELDKRRRSTEGASPRGGCGASPDSGIGREVSMPRLTKSSPTTTIFSGDVKPPRPPTPPTPLDPPRTPSPSNESANVIPAVQNTPPYSPATLDGPFSPISVLPYPAAKGSQTPSPPPVSPHLPRCDSPPRLSSPLSTQPSGQHFKKKYFHSNSNTAPRTKFRPKGKDWELHFPNPGGKDQTGHVTERSHVA